MNTELYQHTLAIEKEIVTLKEIEALICVIMDKCENEAADEKKNKWFVYEWNRCLEDLFYLLNNMTCGVEERLTAIVNGTADKESEGNE